MQQTMKKRNAIGMLQAFLVLVGVVVLAFLLRFPSTEGRAKNLDWFHIYTDPFILYGYAMAIPFFMALYQAFKWLGYIRMDQTFSPGAVKALKRIKAGAIVFGVMMVAAAVYINMAHAEEDDPAGFIAMSLFAAVSSAIVAIAAARLEKKGRLRAKS
jgi:hypothetical protein